MNTIYILVAYEIVLWACIAISLKMAKTDIELWGEEV